jgi:hypothetical protein
MVVYPAATGLPILPKIASYKPCRMISTVLRRLTAVSTRRGFVSLLTAAAWMAMIQIAAAQAPNSAPPPSKDYFLQYLLVGFCVALGMFAALRPSPRKDPEGGEASWFKMALGGGHAPEGPAKPGERRKAPHRGNLLLVLSIAGIFFCIPAVMAISMANQDLAAMKAGRMDKAGEGVTKLSFWIGVGGVVLSLVFGLIFGLVTALG